MKANKHDLHNNTSMNISDTELKAENPSWTEVRMKLWSLWAWALDREIQAFQLQISLTTNVLQKLLEKNKTANCKIIQVVTGELSVISAFEIENRLSNINIFVHFDNSLYTFY